MDFIRPCKQFPIFFFYARLMQHANTDAGKGSSILYNVLLFGKGEGQVMGLHKATKPTNTQIPASLQLINSKLYRNNSSHYKIPYPMQPNLEVGNAYQNIIEVRTHDALYKLLQHYYLYVTIIVDKQ